MAKIRESINYEQMFSEVAHSWEPNEDSLTKYILQHGITHVLSVEGRNHVNDMLRDLHYVAHMIKHCTEIIAVHRQIRLYGLDEWCEFAIDESSRASLDALSVDLVVTICDFTRKSFVRSTSNVKLHEYCLKRAQQENISAKEMTRHIMNLGSVYMNFGLTNPLYFDKAEILFSECMTEYADIVHTDQLMIEVHNELAVLYSRKGNMKKAYDSIVIVAEDFKNLLGTTSANYIKARSNIAFLERTFGNYTKAKIIYDEVLEAADRVLGSKHPDTLSFRQDYLQFLFDTGALTEEQIVRELEDVVTIVGRTHNVALHLLNMLGLWHLSHEQYEKAEVVFGMLIERSRGQVQPMMYVNLAVSLHYQERYNEAHTTYDNGLRLASVIYAHGSNQLAQIQYQFAEFLYDKPDQDLDKAVKLYQASLDSFKVAYGVEHWWVRNVVLDLVNTHQELEQIDAAINVLNNYMQELGLSERDVTARLVVVWTKLGRVYVDTQQFSKGKTYLSQALEYVEINGEVAYARKSIILWYLQKCAWDEGNQHQMLIWLEEAVGLQHIKTPDFCSHNAFLMTTTLCDRYLDAEQIEDGVKWFHLMNASSGLQDYMDAEAQACWDRLSSRIEQYL